MAAAADPIATLTGLAAPPRAGNDWASFLSMVRQLRSGKAEWPADLALARFWYEPHLERVYEDAVVRRADLLQLEQIASGYPSRERLQGVVLDIDRVWLRAW